MDKKIKVMGVASSGGHWIELERLYDVFEGFDSVFVTVDKSYKAKIDGARMHYVMDANANTPFKLMLMFWQIFWVMVKERPKCVLSTGAAPGLAAIIFAKMFGAKTVWIDSAANAEQLSLSGKLVKPFASKWLTQWPNLTSNGGPEYQGSVF